MSSLILPKQKFFISNWTKETELVVLGISTIGGFLLRLYVIRFHPFVNFDGVYYINYFRDVHWQSVFHPGYPLSIELARFFISDGVFAAQIVSAVFGALLPIPLYYVGRHFLNSWMAFMMVMIAVMNPLMVRFSALTMSEAQFIFFELCAFLFYLKRNPVSLGVSSALAYLTRPEALAFMGVFLLYDVIKQRAWKFVSLVCVSFILCAIPYIVYVGVSTGEWTLSPKTMNIRVWEQDWRSNVAKEASTSPEPTVIERAESSIKNYPERFITYVDLLLVFGGIPLFILSVVGMVRHRNILLAGMVMFLFLPLFGLLTIDRFVVPYIPFLAIFAVLTLDYFRNVLVKLLGIAIIIFGYVSTTWYALSPEEGTEEFCRAGVAMKSLTHHGDIFLDRKPYTAFYAGGRYEFMPNDPLDSILTYAKRIHAKYLVTSARVVRVFRPQLADLLYNDSTVQRYNLRTVYLDGLATGYGVRVVEIAY